MLEPGDPIYRMSSYMSNYMYTDLVGVLERVHFVGVDADQRARFPHPWFGLTFVVPHKVNTRPRALLRLCA